MSVLDVLKAAKSKRGPFGPMRLKRVLGEGSNAAVWSAYFPKLMSSKVVKRIKFSRCKVYCKYDWKKAGLKKIPNKLSIVQMPFVVGVFNNKKDIYVDSTHCAVAIDAAITNEQKIKDGAAKILFGTEFPNEVAVGACLALHLNHLLPYQSFCTSDGSWSSKHYGNISMQHAGIGLGEHIDSFDLGQIQSIVLQILINLSWAQKTVHFKHHDLHTGNIFVKTKNIEKNWHTPCGLTFELPSTSKLAVIADFGLSAATDPTTQIRHARIDYDLMTTSGNGWGKWDNVLENNYGYDVLVFLSCMAEDSTDRICKKWLKEALKAARSLCTGLRISCRNRPLKNVPMTPRELLSHPFFEKFLIN